MTEIVIFVNYLFFNRVGALYLKTLKTQCAAFPTQNRELVCEHHGEYRSEPLSADTQYLSIYTILVIQNILMQIQIKKLNDLF